MRSKRRRIDLAKDPRIYIPFTERVLGANYLLSLSMLYQKKASSLTVFSEEMTGGAIRVRPS